MDYDWERIIAELPKGRLWLTYPGDDGSEDEAMRAEKAGSYADWVTDRARAAADDELRDRRQKERDTQRLMQTMRIWTGMAALLAAGIAWAWFQWAECRDLGHTVFYCINHTFG